MRDEGLIPAVVYGNQVEPKMLQVEYLAFQKAYEQAGGSSIIELDIEGGKPVKVLVHDLQSGPLSGRYSHIDFYQFKEGEKVSAEIELEFTGVAPVVKEFGGIVITHMGSVHVKCLPEALVPKIEVALGVLKTIDDVIHVGDLEVPEGMEIVNTPDEAVVTVSAPRVKEEEVPAEGEAAQPEKDGEKKKEEDEEEKKEE